MIYILGGVIFPLVPFLYYPSWRGIVFVMACVTASSLIAFAIYWAWPVSMVRPEFAGGTLGERLMLWVFSVDKPANCFPSLHVIFAVLGALSDRPRRRRPRGAVVLVGVRRGGQRDDGDLGPALLHRRAGRRRGRLGRLLRRSLVGAARPAHARSRPIGRCPILPGPIFRRELRAVAHSRGLFVTRTILGLLLTAVVLSGLGTGRLGDHRGSLPTSARSGARRCGLHRRDYHRDGVPHAAGRDAGRPGHCGGARERDPASLAPDRG